MFVCTCIFFSAVFYPHCGSLKIKNTGFLPFVYAAKRDDFSLYNSYIYFSFSAELCSRNIAKTMCIYTQYCNGYIALFFRQHTFAYTREFLKRVETNLRHHVLWAFTFFTSEKKCAFSLFIFQREEVRIWVWFFVGEDTRFTFYDV